MFQLMQIVYFKSRITGLLTKGLIVDPPSEEPVDSKDPSVLLNVRYFEKQWCYEKYDEKCPITDIFDSLDAAMKAYGPR